MNVLVFPLLLMTDYEVDYDVVPPLLSRKVSFFIIKLLYKSIMVPEPDVTLPFPFIDFTSHIER